MDLNIPTSSIDNKEVLPKEDKKNLQKDEIEN